MFLLKVCSAFEDRGIDYAIAGGYAVALHGAIRGTVDIDFVLKLNLKDYVAAEQALKSIGLQSRLPVRANEVFQFRTEYIEKKNLIAWSFVNPQNPIEVVDIIITSDLKRMKREKVFIAGMPVYILSVADLIKMKIESGRPQDLLDVEALQSLPKRRR